MIKLLLRSYWNTLYKHCTSPGIAQISYFGGKFKLFSLVFIADIGEVIRTRHQQRRRTLSAGKKDGEAIKAATVSYWHF